MKTKLVRIVSVNRYTYWYADQVGRIFEVTNNDMYPTKYQVRNNERLSAHTLDIEDCEDLTPRERILYEIERAEKIQREAMDKVVALKLQYQKALLVTLDDIVPGAAFKSDTISKVYIVLNWNGKYLFSGNENSVFHMYSTKEMTKQEVVDYLNEHKAQPVEGLK
jgi:hypothetical protein